MSVFSERGVWTEDYEAWKTGKQIPQHATLECQGVSETWGKQHEKNTARNSFTQKIGITKIK